MPLFITATYQVKEELVEEVKKAILEFTAYIRENEPGTQMYSAWEEKEDPTKFMHFFIFESEEAKYIHSNSEAVKRFESVYTPALVNGPVVFTNYELVGTN